jgi:hypothetical protein
VGLLVRLRGVRPPRLIRVLDLGAGDAVGGEDVEEIGFGEGEAEGAEGDAEFVVVEVTVAV